MMPNKTAVPFFSIRGSMKKYVVLGILLGLTVSATLVFLRRKRMLGSEFQGFFDSSTVAEELFADGFEELPDKV
jgi:hypothetical protein